MPVVIGGIAVAEIAKVFLENFKQFDFAFWGEDEIHYELLTRFLSNNNNLFEFNVGRVFYRENDKIMTSPDNKHFFLDLSESKLFPDFSDYFEYRNLSKTVVSVDYLLMEGSRGCHWNRCHFCYLNKGCKFRQKNIEKISEEIEKMISTYGIFNFKFIENDIVGKDMDRFHFLLDELIKIKSKYSDFTIIGAEIITHGLSYSTIKKMKEAGIVLIQIGFESACNRNEI